MKNRWMAIAALSSLAASAASAATIDLHWDSNPYNPSNPTDSISYSVTVNGSTTSGSVYPDRYHGTATNPQGGASLAEFVDGVNGSLFTFCYEITQVFNGGSTVTYTVNANGATNATLDFLGGVNYALGGATPFAWLNPIGSYNGIPAVNVAAAIQLGIWETRYDTSWDLGLGNFHATNLDQPTVNALTAFHDAMALAPSLGAQYVVTLENRERQDQITGFRAVSRQTVPEPASLALVAMALGGAALASRRTLRPERRA